MRIYRDKQAGLRCGSASCPNNFCFCASWAGFLSKALSANFLCRCVGVKEMEYDMEGGLREVEEEERELLECSVCAGTHFSHLTH